MVEAVVARLALLPLFMAVNYLGRAQDVQQSAAEGSRYLSWERTVWSAPGGGGATKSDAALVREVRHRAQGGPRGGMISERELTTRGIAVNPIWRDSSGASLLTGADDGAGIDAIRADLRSVPLTSQGYALGAVAHGDGIGAAASSLGLGGDMLGLAKSKLAAHTVSVGIRPRLEGRGSLHLDGRAEETDAPPITFRYRGAVLTDTWRASGDENYSRRVERVVGSEPVETVSALAPLLGVFPLYAEGRYARGTDFVPESGTNLPEYIDDGD